MFPSLFERADVVQITTGGGAVVATVTGKVTHFVCTESEFTKKVRRFFVVVASGGWLQFLPLLICETALLADALYLFMLSATVCIRVVCVLVC